MPCYDDRDRLDEPSLRDHHRAVERILEALLDGRMTPDEAREAYKEEGKTFARDRRSINERGARGR